MQVDSGIREGVACLSLCVCVCVLPGGDDDVTSVA